MTASAITTPQLEPPHPRPERPPEDGRAVRDSLIVIGGGQLERVIGTFTSLALKWGLEPAIHGLYAGLRLFLDQSNRSSLGVGPGAVQRIPILRAAGEEAEARRVANVAFTASMAGALLYALGLLGLAWWWWPGSEADPIAATWAIGLAALAVLVPLKRAQDLYVAIHRAHQRFGLTTRLAVIESALLAVGVIVGLWLAGLWGLLTVLGALSIFNLLYLRARHPMRLRLAWDWELVLSLAWVGLPILANSFVFSALIGLDRVVILTMAPDGPQAAGYYMLAVMGTSWSLDLAGRVATVMYTYFQTTMGRTKDEAAVARQSARTVEAITAPLAAGASIAYVAAPAFLAWLVPRYAPGAEAIRPLLPGVLLLGLALPSRQAMIARGRPYRLALVMLPGLGVAAAGAAIGAVRDGIVGAAWGMTAGYAAVYLLTSAAAFSEDLGPRGWFAHQAKAAWTVAKFGLIALVAAHLPLFDTVGPAAEPMVRGALVSLWALTGLWSWAGEHGWGGLTTPRRWVDREDEDGNDGSQ